MSRRSRLVDLAVGIVVQLAAVFAGALFVVGDANATTPEEYEQRIDALETRIARLEAAVDRLTSKSAPSTATAATAGPGEPAASDPPPPSAATAGGPAAQPSESAASTVAEIKKADEKAIQALYLIRDKAVTLTPRRWEADFEMAFTRDDEFLQNNWALGAIASLHYGLASGLEVGLSVPYDYTHRRSETGAPGGRVVEISAIGDMRVDINKTIRHETEKWPGVVLTGAVGLPTGPDPYHHNGFRPGTLPSDPFTFYRDASGHYSASIGAELIKTVDPFAFFAGLSTTYAFPRTVTGVKVAPGASFGFNVGGTFAVSEATALGFSLNGAVNQPTRTGGKAVTATDTIPLFTTFSVQQKLKNGLYLQPSLTTGLTGDAPDATFAVSTTKTF